MMFEQSNFDNTAQYYDLFELKSQPMYTYILEVLEKYFTTYKVQTILDLACGTGAQAIPLAKKRYRVTACDLSVAMLQIAQQKAKDVEIRFSQGDMRSSYVGIFDAVITIFNSIGYLNRADFLTTLNNIRKQVRDERGLFIFDNTNLDAINTGIFSEGKLIDTAGEYQGKKFVRFLERHVDIHSGLMTINWEACIQQGFQPLETFTGTWHRQMYTLDEMEQMLRENGFRVVDYYDRYGGSFQKTQSFAVLVVAEAL